MPRAVAGHQPGARPANWRDFRDCGIMIFGKAPRKGSRFCAACIQLAPGNPSQLVKSFQARSSVWLERYLDTVEVNGSSPFGPTNIFNNLRWHPFRFPRFGDVFGDIGPGCGPI